MEIEPLIERCRHGEEDALSELYKAYAPKLRSVCRRYISNEDMVNDALHDAFVVIFTSFDTLRDDSKAEAWMVSIARNVALKCNDYAEILPTISIEEINDLELPPSEEGETDVRGLSLSEVIKLIDKLPEGYKQVFRLAVFEGLTHKEIAAMLGIEPHSSSSQLTRAKQMLRKMMQQYWVLLLLLLLPATLLLIKKRDSRLEPIAITNNENAEESVEQPIDDTGITVNHTPATKSEHTSAFEDTIPLHLVDIKDAHALADTMLQIMVDSIPKDPVTPSPYVKELTPNDYIAELAETPIKKQTKHKWQITLAYAATPLPSLNKTDNFMTIPEISVASAPAAKLYNWGDYINYVDNNAESMDSTSASNMRHIAIINSNNPADSLSESKHHALPLTIQLSLSRQITDKWSLSTGLSYSLLRSTYQSGNESTTIKRTQTLHYLGVPVRFNYKLVGGSRWNLYASGGLQVDMPVSGRLNTQYSYGGAYAGIKPASVTEPITNAPWMLSVGAGVGVQVVIIPHMTLYIEPNLNYYVPLTKGVDTYRTERPFDITLPVGIRFSW